MGVRPCLPSDLILSLGEAGLAASPLDSPAHEHTPRQRSSPTGLQMSRLSRNGTPELPPGRGNTRAEWLQEPFCAVLSVDQQGSRPPRSCHWHLSSVPVQQQISTWHQELCLAHGTHGPGDEPGWALVTPTAPLGRAVWNSRCSAD